MASNSTSPIETVTQEAATTSTTTTMLAIRTAKRQLRKSMASKLASLQPDEVLAQSRQVAQQILSSKTYAKSKAVSVYVNMDVGEVVTDEICRSILRDGKRLYVPLFASTEQPATATGPTVPTASTPVKKQFATDMLMLRLRDLGEYESMLPNSWGIREPTLKYPDGTLREEALDESTGGQGLDLILAPGVAFDVSGGRLGHGKGYYDRYLTKAHHFAATHHLPQSPITVALALRQQILPPQESVPMDENDRTLDAIISPDGVIIPPSLDQCSGWQQ